MTERACYLFDTAFGRCGLSWSAAGLTRLRLPEADAAATMRRLRARADPCGEADAPPPVVDCIALLRRYFAGETTGFDAVALDIGIVSAFNAAVYGALRQVRHGETVTYGDLAKRIGEPGAARAVGAAMATNPWPIIVPCHRVLAAAGKLGGFSAPGGAATKLKLLRMEGAAIDQGMPLFGHAF